jgi:hypothetical protein
MTKLVKVPFVVNYGEEQLNYLEQVVKRLKSLKAMMLWLL